MEEPTPSPNVSYANVTSKSTHPTKHQAIIIDSIDGIMIRDYLLSLSKVTKSSSIRFISRISNSRICVYLDSKQTADELVDVVKKVKVKDHLLEIRPLLTRNKRIVLSNVCPVIPHEVIEEKFNEMSIKIMSPITYMKVGISDPGFSHIMSFRRQVYVSPEDEKRLPESMLINYDDTNYWIYITNESMKCFVCNGMGHLAKHCPQSNQPPMSTQPINSQSHTQENKETSSFLPIKFNKPQTQSTNTNQPPSKPDFNKGNKRIHSTTTSELSESDNKQTDFISESPFTSLPLSDCTDDTDSNYSVEEESPNNKSLKKKKKTLDNRTEEQVWNDIQIELKESENTSRFPITLDQFISLLDRSRNKQNIQEIIMDYSENIPELIDMCLFLHPKMNKNLKNRCSRFSRKLQDINSGKTQ